MVEPGAVEGKRGAAKDAGAEGRCAGAKVEGGSIELATDVL